MTSCKQIAVATIIHLLLVSAGLGAENRSLPEIAIGRQNAGLLSLAIDDRKVSFSSEEAGFEAYDATAGRRIAFSKGTVKGTADGIAYDCQASGVRLRAEFARRNGFILVSGSLENTHQDERGLILGYRVPVISPDSEFSNALDHAVAMTDSEEYEGNAFPIAAMCGKDTSIAMAIPPSEPRIFGMAGGAKGMTIRFYLGMSPETKSFPNRAPFAFMLYLVEPAWGFRSALSKYYGFFPDGYLRDKKLLDWYVPLVRNLSRAGWEPVTHAAISGEKALLERFGSGDHVYFTVFSENKVTQDCTLAVDLDALGAWPSGCVFSEIARGTPLSVSEGNQVTLSVAPLKCCIVALTRSP